LLLVVGKKKTSENPVLGKERVGCLARCGSKRRESRS